MTEKADTNENVSQRTNDGSLVSSPSISIGVEEVFKDSEEEITYGGEPLQPFIFVDDILRACLTVESLIKGNILMEEVMEGKLLDFNVAKSNYMIIGSNKLRKPLEKELEGQTIKLCGKEMKRTESGKWLGDYIHSLGINESYHNYS